MAKDSIKEICDNLRKGHGYLIKARFLIGERIEAAVKKGKEPVYARGQVAGEIEQEIGWEKGDKWWDVCHLMHKRLKGKDRENILANKWITTSYVAYMVKRDEESCQDLCSAITPTQPKRFPVPRKSKKDKNHMAPPEEEGVTASISLPLDDDKVMNLSRWLYAASKRGNMTRGEIDKAIEEGRSSVK